MIKKEELKKETKKCYSCLENTAKIRYNISERVVFDLCEACDNILRGE